MSDPPEMVYMPIPENTKQYAVLYREYAKLSDYFGRGENDVMKRLRKIAAETRLEEQE